MRRIFGGGSQQPPDLPRDVQPPEAPPTLEELRPPEHLQPRPQPVTVEDVDWDLRRVEGVQAERAKEGRMMGPRELDLEGKRLGRVTDDIIRLDDQAKQGTLDSNQVADLKRRLNEVARQFGEDVRAAQAAGGPATIALQGFGARQTLQWVEEALNDARKARAEGRPTEYQTGERSLPADQEMLDSARRRLEQEQGLLDAGADPRDHARLAELEHWIREVQQRLDNEQGNLGNAMSSTDLNTQPPGYGLVKPGQVQQLPGATAMGPLPGVPGMLATEQLPGLPGTTAAKQISGLPGTTATKLDNRPLHAETTATQKTKTRPWTDAEFDAEFQRVINAGRLAGALNLVAVMGLAPGALSSLLLKAQTVRVPGASPR
jgi:hypothetical protein